MKIYVPGSEEDFELCQPEAQEDFETLHVRINGFPQQQTWQPIAMRLVREDQGKELLRSDSPWLGAHALIFRKSATDVMGALLREYGEVLPLRCAEADLEVFNPTKTVDALDEQASAALRFSSGRIMRITRHVFRAEVLAGIDVFKIPNLRVSPTFVSARFVEAWSAADLRGLVFKEVWSG